MRKDQVYTELMRRILNFTLKPGQAVSINQIADEFGVSTMPVREAFIHLTIDKLLEVYPQSGTYVSRINLDYVHEVALMRHILEREMLFAACDAGKVVISAEIEKCCNRQKEALSENDVEAFLRYDNHFHRLLFGITGHEIIWDQILNIKIHFNRFRFLDMACPNILKLRFEEHLAILDFLQRGDKAGLEKLLPPHHFVSSENENVLIEQHPDYFTRK